MTFEEAKTVRDALEATVQQTGRVLSAFPKGQLGLTPDAVRATPEYRAAKTEYDHAFQKLRTFNATFTKVFKDDLRRDRQERDAKRAAKHN